MQTLTRIFPIFCASSLSFRFQNSTGGCYTNVWFWISNIFFALFWNCVSSLFVIFQWRIITCFLASVLFLLIESNLLRYFEPKIKLRSRVHFTQLFLQQNNSDFSINLCCSPKQNVRFEKIKIACNIKPSKWARAAQITCISPLDTN